MAQEMKAQARRVLEEVWSRGNLDAADQIFAPSAINHDPANPDTGSGPDGVKHLVRLYRGAFPDLQFTVEDQIAEGDRVATRWTARGTHRGDLMGVAPTGRPAAVAGISITRHARDRVEESWVNWDALGLMQQLGVVPQMARST